MKDKNPVNWPDIRRNHKLKLPSRGIGRDSHFYNLRKKQHSYLMASTYSLWLFTLACFLLGPGPNHCGSADGGFGSG